MQNMTLKEKFLFIFLQIITMGLIWIYWIKKNKKVSKENELSYSNKINLDLEKLILYIGNYNNIKDLSYTQTKIKFIYFDRNKIEIEKINQIEGISGVFLNDNFLTIIVGKQAKTVFEKIQNKVGNIKNIK